MEPVRSRRIPLNIHVERKHTIVAAVALMAAVFASPASAQRACPTAPALMGGLKSARPAPAAAKVPLAVVTGGGQGTLTDPDGEKFSHQFSIAAVLNADGSARGNLNFVFPAPFSHKWGALPTADILHLVGEVTAGTLNTDGSVDLLGPFIETDFSQSEGIVYQEDSRVTGASPVRVSISPPPGSRTFKLSWCSFIPPNGTGYFTVEIANGNLIVR